MRLEAEQREKEAAEELRRMFGSGYPSDRMNRAIERLRWLNEIGQGGWRLAGDQPVPSHDQGEFEASVEAAKRAVVELIEPMVSEAEQEYEASLDERAAIVSGRKRRRTSP